MLLNAVSGRFLKSIRVTYVLLCFFALFEYNGAIERSARQAGIRNVGISVNIGIIDMPGKLVQTGGSGRYPVTSGPGYLEADGRRPVSQDDYGFHGNVGTRPIATPGEFSRPVQLVYGYSEQQPALAQGVRPLMSQGPAALPPLGQGSPPPTHGPPPRHQGPPVPMHDANRHDYSNSNSNSQSRPTYQSDSFYETSHGGMTLSSQRPSHGQGALPPSGQVRPVPHHQQQSSSVHETNRHDYTSTGTQTGPIYQTDGGFYDNSNRGELQPGHRTGGFSSKGDEPTRRPNQDTYQENTRPPSHMSGQQGNYGSSGEVERRPLGQSGYPGNDGGILSTVNSFNENVNAGTTRRPQVSAQNSNSFNSQHDTNKHSHKDNGYVDEIDDNFNGNDNVPTRKPTHVTQGNNGRKPVGNTNSFNSNGDVNRPQDFGGYTEDDDDVSESDRTQNRRPSMNSKGNNGRKPSNGESSFVSGNNGGRPLTSGSRYTTTVRSTTRDDYDEETSQTRPHRRTTAKPETSSSGCYLPEQPRGGRYELGGCDSPCDKVPGDFVPNTSVLTYTCTSGFVRNGSAVSVCLNDSWYMPPSCLKTCPPLKSTSVDITCKLRGNIVACDESMEPGTRATLACKPSYKIPLTDDPAYREITCLKDGLWDRRLFRCLPKCGTTIAHGNTLVVNGFTAKVGVFPWHVGIYEKKSRQVYEQICAGTLINSNLVVSAAHCFYDEGTNEVKGASKYYVAAGKHYRSWNREEDYVQKSKVDIIMVADRYTGARGNFGQDIALLKLKSPFELTGLVRPVCLDWDNVLEREHLQVGRYGKAVGWGKTASGQPSEELQEINVPFVPFDQCTSDVPADFRGYITPDKFCAGYMNGSSLCEGDSGGGLCFESNGLWYLRGIVSVSPVRDYSCDYNSYTGFTYFSHFRDWVRNEFLKS